MAGQGVIISSSDWVYRTLQTIYGTHKIRDILVRIWMRIRTFDLRILMRILFVSDLQDVNQKLFLFSMLIPF
jgi:hypothetical protein